MVRAARLALAAALAIGTGALLAGCDPTAGGATGPVIDPGHVSPTAGRPSSAAPVPTGGQLASGPPSSSAPTAGRIALEEIAQPGLFDGPGPITLRNIVSVGPGFTVLGTAGPAATSANDAWLSADGRAWERVHPVAGLDGASIHGLEEMASGRLIAIGLHRAGDTIWTSDDAGRTWQSRLPPTDEHARAFQVTAGAKGALAVGSAPIGRGPEQAPRLWFSPDGATWTAVDLSGDVFGAIEIRGIAATSDGFVAVGGRAPANPVRAGDVTEYRAAAWISPDGLTWSRATVSDRPMMLGVVAGESGLIGYGWGDPIRVPQVWISDTGSTWVANPIQADESPAISTHHGVMSWLDTSVIRSGVASIELRTSRDGLDWTSVGVVEETRHTGIGAFRAGDPGVLQIGGSLDRPAMWLFAAPSR